MKLFQYADWLCRQCRNCYYLRIVQLNNLFSQLSIIRKSSPQTKPFLGQTSILQLSEVGCFMVGQLVCGWDISPLIVSIGVYIVSNGCLISVNSFRCWVAPPGNY